MTNLEAYEWFKNRVGSIPMAGARAAYEKAVEALGDIVVFEQNSLLGELISKDAVLKSCRRYGSEPQGDVPAPYSFVAQCIKDEVLMLPSVKLQKGDNAE